MSRKVNNKKGSSKGPNRGKRSRRPTQSRGQMNQRSPLSDPRVSAWDQLLRDPCAANLAYPCYAGMDSGYLVRTTDYVTPTRTGTFTAGAAVTDYILQVTPFNYSATSGGIAAQGTTGQVMDTSISFGFPNNFITNANSVRRYRPVAACIKWMPSGPYTSRRGIVASGYLTGTEIVPGLTYSADGVKSVCQRYAPNGGEAHEVRWLPTAVDENFTDVTVANNNGAGAVIFVLSGVDAVNTTTIQTLNGTFEVSIVWEWLPSTLAGSITVSPKAPLPYTSQQILGTIQDVGKYIFEGVRVASYNPGFIRGASQAAAALLSGGYQHYGTRAAGMIQQ